MRDNTTIQAPASWEAMRRDFVWSLPARYNIADVTCRGWAARAPDRRALTYLDARGGVSDVTYGGLEALSNRLANALEGLGLRRGDRIAVLLPQSPETVLTHLAAYKLGAIVVPLFTLFGAEGLAFRLSDSGCAMVVTDGANLDKVLGIRDDLPQLRLVLSTDATPTGPGLADFHDVLGRGRDTARMADTGPDDPAFISYTSGTTGPPKGALHGHRVLMGHLPGVELPHGFLPQSGDCLWTPADWAWMGGLMNVMMPSLALGVPLIAHRMARFEPGAAYALMDRLGVRNVFLPPTALKLMRETPPARTPTLRSVASGGEALGAEMLDWGRGALGVPINEFYGQTECNLVLSNCHLVMDPVPGSMGRPVPGHRVAVIDDAGAILPPGQTGEIAVHRPDPAMFLRYWKLPEKTAQKFTGDWMRTGDTGHVDAGGFFHFSARTDDVITSSGYRIGPTEIEHCLTGHPSVTMAAVIGVPDPIRTEAIKAFVVTRPGTAQDGLAETLVAHVRDRLSPHVAPRELVFVDALPMTATGKILRRALKEPAND